MTKTTILSLLAVSMSLASLSFADAETPTLKDIEEASGGLVSNGYVSKVTSYKAAKYNESDEQIQMIKDFVDTGGCADGGMVPRADFKNNLNLLKKVHKDSYGRNPDPDAVKVEKFVKKMIDQKSLKGFLSVSWDEIERPGEHAEGVSCSIYMFRYFTNDGKRLTIQYSNTD